ncbi:MAG TPA: hypothetical protein VNZ26_18210 [Vicinamibacterales bacterium]|nr:hypothetical protein [Vicinamibacterales bacterium]
MKGVFSLKRLLSLLLSILIVPAIEVHLRAAVVISEDVPVPGGPSALAHALGVDPVPDRGRFISEITRLVYDNLEGRNPAAAAFLHSLRDRSPRSVRTLENNAPVMASSPAQLVPIPLSAEVWGNAVFHRRVSREELVSAILSDRQAGLLCHGLAALDDETLEFFAEHQSVLARIYERLAAPFAAFSTSLHIRSNRVEPPGDPAAAALWEAVVGEKVSRPDRFVLMLFDVSDGRLAYLYDTIGQLDRSRRAFALGLWISDPTRRLERFRTLATTGLTAFRDWHVRSLPFARASQDLAMTLIRLDVDASGTPRPPASRAFWSRVFGATAPDETARSDRESEDLLIDAVWLAENLGMVDVRQRSERLDQLAFSQRVFDRASRDGGVQADVFVAVRAFPRQRMLMLSLERIGVTRPALYAAMARQAARIASLDGRRGFLAQAQFQGALSLVANMVRVRSIDRQKSEGMLDRLAALPISDEGRYAGAMAVWLRATLDEIGSSESNDRENALIAALSGSLSSPNANATLHQSVPWEGEIYRLDLASAERRRLHRVREKQEALPIDVVFRLTAIGKQLLETGVTPGDIQGAAEGLTTLAGEIRSRPWEDDAENRPAGIRAGPRPRDSLRRAADELAKAGRAADTKRASRVADLVLDTVDELTAHALLSLAYAVDLGDPEGTILLAEDVSYRHDFGFAAKDDSARTRLAWAVPRAEAAPGRPWQVTGSLLGMDVALSTLALRRVASDRALEAPKLTSNERDGFALTVSLMNPLALTDGDRDRISAAVEGGRLRVLALHADSALLEVATELSISGDRLRALRWTLAREPRRVISMFSLTELLMLGGGHPAELNAWGTAALTTVGCVCSRLTPLDRWSSLSGRPQLGLASVIVADLNLEVAIMLKELRLPAALARVVLSGAVQDFIDEVRPTDDADWLTMARTASSLSRERVEDYVALATATGPLELAHPLEQ